MGRPAPLILLLGMHRSGTSLLGSLLPALGVPLPGPLIAADSHNPAGYFEHQAITALQEQLLIDLGQWWPSQEGVQPLPNAWLTTPAARRCLAELQRLVERDRPTDPQPWAIKDPRTSLLLPLWRQLSQALDLPLRLVLSVRDPREVMVSLLQRDRDAAGMTAWRAQQLWWKHNLAVLQQGHHLPLHVLHYSRWFEQPDQQLQRLAQFCLGHPMPPQQAGEALERIRPEHRRSRRRRAAWPPIHPQLRRLERRLLQLADQPGQRSQLEQWAGQQPLPITLPLNRWRYRQQP